MKKQQVGVIVLAVMGKNLAFNIAEHAFSVAVYNRSFEKVDALLQEVKGQSFEQNITGFYSLKEFVHALERPRKIIMMVKAGDAVDETMKQLLPLLDLGDLLMDGGNSFYQDTIRRSKELEMAGYRFLGTGISGGEEGARKGPAIMPGGNPEAYQMMEPILTAISAKVNQDPCCAYIGLDGAGHFVKMVHNGIEYADMQLISEAYFIMKQVLGLKPMQLHEVFKDWNQGELNSYLIDITTNIFLKKDNETDHPLVDMILDVAGQKGTGKWTGQISLELGAPTPSITTAVFERYLSAMKEERVLASGILKGPEGREHQSDHFIEAIRKALYASKICVYAQGFDLMKIASQNYGWKLNLAEIAKIFRGGCIIRAQFLDQISKAYEKSFNYKNLLLEDYFKNTISEYQVEWREVIKTAISMGIPAPAFTSALEYYDTYRSNQLPMNLIQAQRDYFGAHTYQRIDKPGIYHTEW